MKTSTALILAGAGVVVLFVLTRKSTSLPASTFGSSQTTLLGGLGQLLGGAILGAGGTIRTASSPGVVTSSSTYAPGVGSNGDSEVAIVRSLDAGGIASYDAQGSPDAPVFGIAGVDY